MQCNARFFLKGLCEPIVCDSPYKYTKRGICLDQESLQQLYQFTQKNLLSTYLESDVTVEEKVTKFINYACKNFRDDLNKLLENYNDVKIKEKNEFISKVLFSMLEHDPEYAGDEYKLKKFKDILIARSQVLFPLLNLHFGDDDA